jgi:hypothetical protein
MTFLSCSLRPEDDAQVNAYFKDIFGFYGIETETINIPGLSEEQVIELVKQHVPRNDGVIVLWTPRYFINGYLPSMWTILESVVGIAKDKPVYVFYEQGVSLEGPLKALGKVHIEFNRSYFCNQEEHERICAWAQWMKDDLEKNRMENSKRNVRNLICVGLGALSLFVFGFIAGRASCSKKASESN